MGKKTAISWCHHTFNLWWGCEHAPAEPGADDGDISEECRNCYAETFDHRVGGEHWGPGREPRWFGDAYWAKLRCWNIAARKAGERRQVFVSSMADWAQRHRDPAINARMDRERARLWGEILACPWLDFLLLTKRAERLPELLPWETGCRAPTLEPWPNAWVGVTCGTRRSLWRVARLRAIRAAVRFISGEPLLGDIAPHDWDLALCPQRENPEAGGDIHWLIIGDESGPHRRAVDATAVRDARDAAERNGVAFHLKQLHVNGKKVHLPVFDGRRHAEFPRG